MYRLVRLNFGRSPTHFGELGIGLEQTSERVRSDGLFSAWVSTYARLFGGAAIEDLLNQCQADGNPPFRLSSTFVYRRDGKDFIDYIPTPIQRPVGYPNDPERELKVAKTYRKLSYLSLPIWQRWYQGIGFTDEDFQSLENYATDPKHRTGQLGKSGTFDYKKAFKEYELPKVSIDRTTRATNFYHTGLTQFAWEPAHDNAEKDNVHNLAGLYFLIEFPDVNQELESQLQAALHLLGEDGLGGERSSGAGRFEILSWEELSDNWQSVINFKADCHSLISLYWTKEIPQELLEEAARYSLIERGGWIASAASGRQLRRKKVHMFAEGSVFTGKPKGQLANVTPRQFEVSPGVYRPHPIYRSGIALSLPIKVPA